MTRLAGPIPRSVRLAQTLDALRAEISRLEERAFSMECIVTILARRDNGRIHMTCDELEEPIPEGSALVVRNDERGNVTITFELKPRTTESE